MRRVNLANSRSLYKKLKPANYAQLALDGLNLKRKKGVELSFNWLMGRMIASNAARDESFVSQISKNLADLKIISGF